MKDRINPALAIGAVVVVLAIVGFFIWRGTGVGAASGGEKPPGMPQHAQEKWSQYTAGQRGSSVPAVQPGVQPAGAAMPGAPAGSSIPTGPGTVPGAPGMPGAPAGTTIPTGPPLR